MEASLKTFSLAGLTKLNPKQGESKVDATIGLDADRILRPKYEKHAQDHRVRSRSAKALLERLPEPGEVFTVLMSGAFDGWDFVEALLQLAAPATIAELYVATLGFGEANAGHLIGQLDAGTIGSVWFVASCYMRDKHGDKFACLSDALRRRGHHIRATRNHAKIIAMKLTDGRRLAIDGSLNLCACKCAEQAHVWHDAELFEFYAGYIREQAEAEGHVK